MKKLSIVICLLFLLTGCRGVVSEEPIEDLPEITPIEDSEDSSDDETQETPVDSVIIDEEPIGVDERNGVFEILDLREDKNKTDLRGRYEVEGRVDVYFEIFDDYAVLCDVLDEYNKEGWNFLLTVDALKVLEIEFAEGIDGDGTAYKYTRLGFVYKTKWTDALFIMDLISEKEGIFVWPVFDEPESWAYFIKVK